MKRREFLKFAGTLGYSTVLGGITVGGRKTFAQQIDRVVFKTSYIFFGKDAAWFGGRERGIWTKNRIDVDIRPGTGSTDVAKLVGYGKDEFGIVDPTALMTARVNYDMPIKAVGLHFAKNASCLISKTKANIKTPKDLEGKTLATSIGTLADILSVALFKMHGVDKNKIKIIATTPGAWLQMLVADQVDAVPGFIPDSLPPFKKLGLVPGENLNVMRFADWGFEKFMGHVIVTSDPIITKRKDLVERFVLSAFDSLRFAVRNPDEAVTSLLKVAPTLDRDIAAEGLKLSLELLPSKEATEHTLGWMAKERWEWSQDLWLEMGQIKRKLPVEEFFTNEFLSGPPFRG